MEDLTSNMNNLAVVSRSQLKARTRENTANSLDSQSFLQIADTRSSSIRSNNRSRESSLRVDHGHERRSFSSSSVPDEESMRLDYLRARSRSVSNASSLVSDLQSMFSASDLASYSEPKTCEYASNICLEDITNIEPIVREVTKAWQLSHPEVGSLSSVSFYCVMEVDGSQLATPLTEIPVDHEQDSDHRINRFKCACVFDLPPLDHVPITCWLYIVFPAAPSTNAEFPKSRALFHAQHGALDSGFQEMEGKKAEECCIGSAQIFAEVKETPEGPRTYSVSMAPLALDFVPSTLMKKMQETVQFNFQVSHMLQESSPEQMESSSKPSYKLSENTFAPGSFGRITIGNRDYSKRQYVIKCVSLSTLVDEANLENNGLRRTLKLFNMNTTLIHPFVARLRHFYLHHDKMYLVAEYARGTDLYSHLKTEGQFSEERCQFYGAQIVLGIQYLHSRKLIYRDLKLWNIVLDLNGFVKLTDVGYCSLRARNEVKEILEDVAVQRSSYGTLNYYLAPEIVAAQKYSYAVDWWAFGIIMFEMRYGFPPFYQLGQQNEVYNLLSNIRLGKFSCPTTLASSMPFKELVSSFLVVDPVGRLGANRQEEPVILMHPFFKGVNWEQLVARQAPVPPSWRLGHALLRSAAPNSRRSHIDINFWRSAVQADPLLVDDQNPPLTRTSSRSHSVRLRSKTAQSVSSQRAALKSRTELTSASTTQGSHPSLNRAPSDLFSSPQGPLVSVETLVPGDEVVDNDDEVFCDAVSSSWTKTTSL